MVSERDRGKYMYLNIFAKQHCLQHLVKVVLDKVWSCICLRTKRHALSPNTKTYV